MYYVPVVVIPGKLACTKYSDADCYARLIGSMVYDEYGNITADYSAPF